MKNYGFTIVVPVARGGQHFEECVNSVLSLEYDNYNIKILENKSSHDTIKWLHQTYTKKLELYPSKEKLTAEKNWARALELQKNEFMVFVGEDDILDANYLSVINKQINNDKDASIYFAHFRYIDTSGKLIRDCRKIQERETTAEYLAGLFSHKRDTYGTGYAYRSADYTNVGGIPQWDKLIFADDALWMTMMSRGWASTAKETCFSVRIGEHSSGAKIDLKSWISGIDLYSKLLKELANSNHETRAAYDKYSADYFYGWIGSFISIIAKQESKEYELTFQNTVFALNALRKHCPRKIKKVIKEFPWLKLLSLK